MISPLLANVYLHVVLEARLRRDVFDLWAVQWRDKFAIGDVIIVRYADDIVVGFQYEADARRFWDDMGRRLQEFALTLHPEKTRLIEFGRVHAEHGGAMTWGRTALDVGTPNRRRSTSWGSLTSVVARAAAGSNCSDTRGATGQEPRSGRSRTSCDSACTSRFPSRENG